MFAELPSAEVDSTVCVSVFYVAALVPVSENVTEVRLVGAPAVRVALSVDLVSERLSLQFGVAAGAMAAMIGLQAPESLET